MTRIILFLICMNIHCVLCNLNNSNEIIASQESMCGRISYNKNHQICCQKDNPTVKNDKKKCCGQYPYNPQIESCCGSKPYSNKLFLCCENGKCSKFNSN